MSHWVCCNACFLPPSSERRMALTSCGHVVCSVCYHKGQQSKCLICNNKCQVSSLTDQSRPEVKALFANINSVANKHLSEIRKVLMFQAKHGRKLQAHYQKRNEKLEEGWLKMKQEMQHMAKKLNEQSDYIAKLEYSLQSLRSSSMSHMSQGSQSAHGRQVLQIPFSPPVSLSRHSSSSNIADNMEVDERLSFFQKPVAVTRLSLISPPHDGRMGTVSHRMSSQMANHSTHSATVSRSPRTPTTPNVSFGHASAWNTPIFQPSRSFRAHPPP
ncbi:probable E3 SUMO-protein ligase RNF212 [Phyllopteryx taeniolatus]|uniref:probable E3 SUMO-protein ligase RNF212 n=1 Tax=Phyllopteryx taeniolatus TaxID=161469 RepID=UPI002AD58AFF|nr:probable E3 SUMO-protein ligase RNF212 [Phyllopteryx taeniolatus]XP_061644505.1 probable E3 SUMO-protein ligase RNF212 [Phyllopteryx taeniolatus]